MDQDTKQRRRDPAKEGKSEPLPEWYALSSETVLRRLETSLSGLKQPEAKKRLSKNGKNALPKRGRSRAVGLFLSQFNDMLAWILLVAAALAFVTGAYRDTVIILVIVFTNGLIGFLQEYKAERILERMRTLTTDKAFVIRDGERHEVDAATLVPGDIVFVDAGTRMPADGYIIESYACRVDGFIFSGESRPEDRRAGVMDGKTALADISNMIFMGESVVSGEARLVVVATGIRTELGRLATITAEVVEDLTPLQKRMRLLGRSVAALSVFIGIVVMAVGQYLHLSWYENFLIALALAVSVVPEGLPAAISVALAFGMQRLLGRKVLAKRLSAVETLGSVTTICTDKTGTITRNELMVTRVVVGDRTFTVSGAGYRPEGGFFLDGRAVNPRDIPNGELLFRIAALCNDADLVQRKEQFSVLGDPTEGALVVAARKYAADPGFFTVGQHKVTELPFSSERMRMSVAYRPAGGQKDSARSYVKGSPDVLLELSSRILMADGTSRGFSDEEKRAVKEQYDDLSRQALRVLAFASRDLSGVPESRYAEEMERELVWVGMLAMIDPPRPGVAEAVEECRNLGIRVVMITGDYALTAEAIAREAGIVSGGSLAQVAEHGLAEGLESAGSDDGDVRHFEVITGSVLGELTDEEVMSKVRARDVVFARIAPEQKLRIATILQSGGEVIAMTGDGVNDAPALKKSDVGIAMGIIGTDVSKEAADMILLDDNFASIVNGAREGRTIYANLRKFVHYVFTSNVSELLTVVFGFILQVPAPISAVQILAIDLGTDVFPSFALGLEPAEPDQRTSRPVSDADTAEEAGKSVRKRDIIRRRVKRLFPKQKIIDASGVRRLITIGSIMSIGAVAAFFWSLVRDGWRWGDAIDTGSGIYLEATVAAYAVLAVSQMANMFEARSERLRMREVGWFRNLYAWGALLISLGILWMFLYVPVFQKYLGTRPIDGSDWLAVGATTFAVFLYEEWRKARIARRMAEEDSMTSLEPAASKS